MLSIRKTFQGAYEISNGDYSRQYMGYAKKEAVSLFKYETRIVYLNMKGPNGVETVDSLCRADFSDNKAFQAEIKRLVSEYRLAGMAVYPSSRSTNN